MKTLTVHSGFVFTHFIGSRLCLITFMCFVFLHAFVRRAGGCRRIVSSLALRLTERPYPSRGCNDALCRRIVFAACCCDKSAATALLSRPAAFFRYNIMFLYSNAGQALNDIAAKRPPKVAGDRSASARCEARLGACAKRRRNFAGYAKNERENGIRKRLETSGIGTFR